MQKSIMKKVTLEEKMAIKKLIEEGKTYREISELLSIGFYAVRKWGRIIKKGEKLTPQMGRPKTGSLSTFSKIHI